MALVALAACSDDDSSEGARDDDPPSPLLPADDELGSRSGGALVTTSTLPEIPQGAAPADLDCPDGKVRWVTERTTIEDSGIGEPRAWNITVIGRVENRTSETIVTGNQDIEITIVRPPTWDGLTPYYTSAPPEDGTLAPGERTSWRAEETLQSDARPRVGSVRARPIWADDRIGKTCPPPAGEGAKPRPDL